MPAELISITAARERTLAATTALPPVTVPIDAAYGRILAGDVAAATDLPSFANSAMDGFAVTHGPAGRTLQIVGEARAGAPAQRTATADEAVRISTGAPLPSGVDAVIPIEQTTERDGAVTLAAAVSPGQHIRHPGEDLRAGTTVLSAGRTIGAAELGVAVGAGVGALRCGARPRVAIICTGDELRPAGAPLEPGAIHNSNAPILTALIREAGGEPLPPVIVGDDRAATEAAFAAALAAADVTIASGGISVGRHDHVKPALAALGVTERFWGVNLQPGRPTWFGDRGRRLVFGLPGNPVSAYVTFLLFARPALLALQGAARPLPARALAATTAALERKGREQVVRVTVDEGDGRLRIAVTGAQRSHMTSSLLGADALAFIPAGAGTIAAGATVELERI